MPTGGADALRIPGVAGQRAAASEVVFGSAFDVDPAGLIAVVFAVDGAADGVEAVLEEAEPVGDEVEGVGVGVGAGLVDQGVYGVGEVFESGAESQEVLAADPADGLLGPDAVFVGVV